MAETKPEVGTKGEEPDPNADVHAFLASITSAKTVNVYRLDLAGKPAFCESVPWQTFNLTQIRDRWGGGSFRIAVYGKPSKDHPGGMLGTADIDIAGPEKDLTAPAPAVVDPNAAALEAERQRVRDLEQTVEELKGQKLEERVNSALEAMGRMLEEMRRPPPQAADANPLQMALEIVKQMEARVAPHVTTPTPDGGNLLIEGLKLGLEIGGRETGGGYDSVIERLGVPLIDILQRRLGGLSGAPSGAGAPAGMSGEPSTEVSTVPTNIQEAMQAYVPYLVGWARSNRNPGTCGEFVGDQLDDRWAGELAGWLHAQGGSAITTLLGWFPALGPHRAWCEDFLQSLRAYLLDDDQEGAGDEEKAG